MILEGLMDPEGGPGDLLRSLSFAWSALIDCSMSSTFSWYISTVSTHPSVSPRAYSCTSSMEAAGGPR
ncbi:hypothetical protein EYF80_039130 [Liparis tanakae]|uniref:Uncharacterized protein n=1 Tax=Liparis tanakae TaxID=230148 RepID=A0A4Z2GBQ0_9TELE|nr:hypothetical protein EYF80_039130 [Liparis tanakae]